MEKCPPPRTVSTKIPASLVEALEQMALYRGVSRSFLLRELVEAAVAGRVLLGTPPRHGGMTIGQAGASDVGVAAREQARRVVEAECRGDLVEPGVAEAAHDVGEVVRRTTRRIAEGR
jgi:hypothetical protein